MLLRGKFSRYFTLFILGNPVNPDLEDFISISHNSVIEGSGQ
ncbi:hypothetical protein CLV24_107115 [Pontibacter ummariensis]|uniref:Uncharacterized protein n=1 Tax=Pontibacter ummariensis TaxID=1610492 RepID=A0A239EWB8_9BACT|nr:hypothetical protein CLV24_107115 [Pontibacter ummariensis]SNS48192.1 hypothetical protein SAMN06296052_10773 [Pontibacter ummariensis]